jgi:mRNA-degrading endonuclease RelE of RelBE toxin-antitoxin system
VRRTDALALRGVILALGEDQHPPGSGKLAGSDLWRVRIRIDSVPWRIIYQVRKQQDLVVVARVVRRDEATYRRVL